MQHDEAPERVLRAHGLRVTRPRIAVFAALRDAPHASAGEVLDRARAAHATLSSQAVYGILDDFVDAAIARRFVPTAGAARYELRPDDNHHHFVCVECGRIEDVACDGAAAPCLEPRGLDGAEVLAAEVTFHGRCADCLAAAAAPADATSPNRPVSASDASAVA